MSGIYIHIPFCKQACHYCDFHFSTSLDKKEAMLAALGEELRLRKGEFENEVVETIYFGGGTPSVLNVPEITRLLSVIHDNYQVHSRPEITLEANPDDLTTSKLKALARSAINRLSIGVQSFDDADLQMMNRAHNAKEAIASVEAAVDHFENSSIDLIYGIPGMDNRRWQRQIETAIAFEIPHISSYALTVEPRTALAQMVAKGRVQAVDDDKAQEHFLILVDTLEAAGYENYELSNFGKPGYRSRNNTAYWQQKKYMGIGPSAHSYDGLGRGWNVRNNPKYIRAIAKGELPMETEVLSLTDRYNEYVMTGLRTIWGISFKRIGAEFGTRYLEHVQTHSQKYLREHLLYIEGDTLRATRRGLFLADGIAADLFVLKMR